MSRGALIVFEGCDRVGKSTQCKRLMEALNAMGKKCQLLHFPERTTAVGKQIDAYLQKKMDLPDRTVHLLFAANRWELESQMKDSLKSGVSLIVDRYAFSGVAYTAAKEVAPIWWLKAPDVGIPKPDKVFYLTLPLEVAKERAVYGEERYEKIAFQKKVERQYEELKEKEWLTVDASKDIESIHKEILTETLQVIERCREQPIAELWIN